MLPEISKIRGVHPGALLKRELKNLGIGGTELAEKIDEHKQTISAILNERRGITPSLSIKLAKQFNIADDYFMMLQAGYEVKSVADEMKKITPDLTQFRKVLFWDTDFHKLDWGKNKRAIIKRILERGNKKEIETMISFYGKDIVAKEIRSIKSSFLPSFKVNAQKYRLIAEFA
ncbi:HigA family addiction module antitoxin [Niabella ginsengisoli]|uniref:HigA family addiction module antitoxin n=1 Tax=Niabella ginsengisoli TaxID=522298 RepID=A0ABS9SI38_9BACT|nr:HigA family addiction module antitoxin [Niabella ginsengisoli]MCH5598036.1 HigA family addiction module antitoxin [Niabella ginsengisoli]